MKIQILVLWASLIDTDYDKVIHIDEKFIKVKKDKFAYLFVAVDRKTDISNISCKCENNKQC